MVIDGKRRNLKNRRYCIGCSPFGGRGVAIRGKGDTLKVEKECSLCGKRYALKGNLCSTCFSNIRRIRTKIAAITILGGKCHGCGWKGNPLRGLSVVGFTFHHKNKDKKFNIGKMLNYPWSTIKEELKKCELLCVRCHCTEHASVRNEAFIETVLNYSGKNKEIEDAVKKWFS